MPKTRKTTKRKRRRGGAKGSPFERHMCKELSLWWTGGKRDDVFWRTASSGGRATQRAKTKRGTFGQEGDVQATDPIGQPLMNLFAIELKRGYNKTTIQDLLDRPFTRNPRTGDWMISEMESFINQAREARIQGGAKAWMLVQQRDRRDAVLLFPKLAKLQPVCHALRVHGKHYASITFTSRNPDVSKAKNTVVVTTWEDFKHNVKPKLIYDLHG